MPAIYTPAQPEIERRDPGSGGRGPIDRKPTGGGDDSENWGDRPVGRRGPRELLGTYRLCLFLFLAGDLMFFATLVTAFFLRRDQGHWDPELQSYVMVWHSIHIPQILWLNTVFLALSSISMELGRRRIFRDSDVMAAWLGMGNPGRSGTVAWLAATLGLGICFLAGQYRAWQELWAQGVFLRSGPASQFFYIVTAAHAFHLGLAFLGLAISGLIVGYNRRVQASQIAVDITGWYWHSMGVLWIFLFFLLEIAQRK